MTTAEKIETVKTLVDDSTLTDSVVGVYLKIAEDKILARRFPHGTPNIVNPVGRYEMLQCELTARLLNRRGGEGELTHKEGGIDRTYASVNDEDLLCEVVQVIL